MFSRKLTSHFVHDNKRMSFLLVYHKLYLPHFFTLVMWFTTVLSLYLGN